MHSLSLALVQLILAQNKIRHLLEEGLPDKAQEVVLLDKGVKKLHEKAGQEMLRKKLHR